MKEDLSVTQSELGAKTAASGTHTPEPWICYKHGGTHDKATIALVGEYTVARDGQSYEFHGHDEADASRIVACVNACSLMPIEDVEELAAADHGVMRVVILADDYKRERDELAASLRKVIESCRSSNGFEWTGSLRCPNPTVDGPKFAHAEQLLAKVSA